MRTARRGRNGFAILRAALALCFLTLLISPIVRDPSKGWPLGPARRAVAGLALLTLGVYGIRWRRTPSTIGCHPLDLLLIGVLPYYALVIGNGGILTSGDNQATRAIGVAVVQHHSLDVSSYPPFDRYRDHYSIVETGGRWLPRFPLGTGLLSVPYAAVALSVTPEPITDLLLRRWERHFSALLGCTAVVLFFLAVRQRVALRGAARATAVFAMATTVLSSVSQAMWSTSGEVCCLTLAMYLLFGDVPRPAWRSVGAGISLAAAFACRPTAVALAVMFMAVAAYEDRRSAVPLVLASAFGVGAVCLLQLQLYGNVLGGYGLMNVQSGLWKGVPLRGLAGNLLSPSRGLLVFFPYAIFLPLGLKRSAATGLRHWWMASASAVVFVLAASSFYGKWWGGASLGPRLLTEAAPFMALLTLPLIGSDERFRGWRAAFWATVAFAAATQVLLIYNPAANRWTGEAEVDSSPARLWSIRDSQLAAAWGFTR